MDFRSLTIPGLLAGVCIMLWLEQGKTQVRLDSFIRDVHWREGARACTKALQEKYEVVLSSDESWRPLRVEYLSHAEERSLIVLVISGMKDKTGSEVEACSYWPGSTLPAEVQ